MLRFRGRELGRLRSAEERVEVSYRGCTEPEQLVVKRLKRAVELLREVALPDVEDRDLAERVAEVLGVVGAADRLALGVDLLEMRLGPQEAGRLRDRHSLR